MSKVKYITIEDTKTKWADIIGCSLMSLFLLAATYLITSFNFYKWAAWGALLLIYFILFISFCVESEDDGLFTTKYARKVKIIKGCK